MAERVEEHLTPYEHTRRALHRATDRIIRAWPHALTDANARGYPTGTSGVRTSDTPDPTGNTATRPDHAVAWLAELGDILIALEIRRPAWTPDTGIVYDPFHDAVNQLAENWLYATRQHNQLVRRIINLANQAAIWWPQPPTKGNTIAGVTVGERGNQIETCAYCDQPVAGGAADPIRRIDGQAFHKSPCWYAVATSRGVHPRQKESA